MTSISEHEPRGCDRRIGDRRRAAQPLTGADRRIGERRSGHDRRSRPRA